MRTIQFKLQKLRLAIQRGEIVKSWLKVKNFGMRHLGFLKAIKVIDPGAFKFFLELCSKERFDFDAFER